LLRVSGALKEICWQAEAGEMLGFQVAIDATEADWFQEAEIPSSLFACTKYKF